MHLNQGAASLSGYGEWTWALSVRQGEQPSECCANASAQSSISHNVYYVNNQNRRRRVGTILAFLRNFLRREAGYAV